MERGGANRRRSSTKLLPSEVREAAARRGSVKGSRRSSIQDVDVCGGCGAEFSMYREQHRCKHCRGLTCELCSVAAERGGGRSCRACCGVHASYGRRGSITTGTAKVDAAKAVHHLIKQPRFNRTFLYKNVRLGYAETGDLDGYTVFLILGQGVHRHVVLSFDGLARRHGLHIVIIDRPGAGLSQTLPRGNSSHASAGNSHTSGAHSSSSSRNSTAGDEAAPGWSTAERVAAVGHCIAAYCQTNSIKHAGIIGQSMGAVCAIRAAVDVLCEDLLSCCSLYLVSPWLPFPPGKSQRKISLRGMIGQRDACSTNETSIMEAPVTKELFLSIDNNGEPRDQWLDGVQAALEMGGGDWKDKWDYFGLTSGRPLQHSVYIFHGDRDSTMPLSGARWLEENLASCKLFIKEGGTHALMYDRSVMSEVFRHVAAELRAPRDGNGNAPREREYLLSSQSVPTDQSDTSNEPRRTDPWVKSEAMGLGSSREIEQLPQNNDTHSLSLPIEDRHPFADVPRADLASNARKFSSSSRSGSSREDMAMQTGAAAASKARDTLAEGMYDKHDMSSTLPPHASVPSTVTTAATGTGSSYHVTATDPADPSVTHWDGVYKRSAYTAEDDLDLPQRPAEAQDHMRVKKPRQRLRMRPGQAVLLHALCAFLLSIALLKVWK